MAEKALKKLEQQLNCSVCLDTYSSPKELQCHHVYCEKCLGKLIDKDQQSLTCPNCRQVTPVNPASGVVGLQTAFHINHLLEIQSSFKKINETGSGAVAMGHAHSPSPVKAIHCSIHAGKVLDLFCDTCEDLVCLKCVLKGGSHHDHDCREAEEAFEKYKEELLSSLEPMERHLVTINKALTQLEARCGEISNHKAAIEASINQAFRNLQEVLDARKTKLINQLHEITRGKLKDLAVQKDMMETTHAQLSSYLLLMEENIKTGHQGEALRMKNTTLRQVKKLTTTTLRFDNLEPDTHADTLFSASADVLAVCEKFGDIVVPLEVDPSKCYATGDGLEKAVVGEESTVVLQVIDYKGRDCEIPIHSNSYCELVSEITGTRVSSVLKRIRKKNQSNTRYKVSYRPTIKGRHQLHITVKGKHIKGSPFSVSVTSPYKKFSTDPILTITGVNEPESVAINRRGEIIVTESGRNCVTVFSPSGERLRVFGSYGSGQEHLDGPRGVTLDNNGNIFVTDNGNNRIQKFTAEGQFLATVGTKGSGPLHFHDLRGIAFNPINRKLYVVDRYPNHCVQVLNSDFTFHMLYGKKGVGLGLFDYPWGITCDNTGKVYVADTSNGRILVFTSEMVFLYFIGGKHQFIGIGHSYSILDLPVTVAVDKKGVVYVGDHGRKNYLSVFTPQGNILVGFNCSSRTNGLAVDDSGILYVTLRSSNCIHLF